uniref:Uncharacterized protein n=1 Tax=Anguilla anguilla TaxID=7936 RepID=A0A0E9RXA3_ANGAN
MGLTYNYILIFLFKKFYNGSYLEYFATKVDTDSLNPEDTFTYDTTPH